MANLKLVFGILSICSLVALSNGFNFEEFRSKRQAEEFTTEHTNNGGGNCQFPRRAFRCDCCTMPDEILGNLSSSFRKCFGKKWDEYKKNRHQDENEYRNQYHHGRWEGRNGYSGKQEMDPDDEGGYNPGSSTPDYNSGERPEEGPGTPGGSDGERPRGPGEFDDEGPGSPGESDGEGPGGPGGSDEEGPGGRGPGGPGGPGGRGPGGPGGRGPGGPGGRGPGGPGGRGPGGPGGRGPGGPGGRGPGGPGGRGPGGRGPGDPDTEWGSGGSGGGSGQGPDCDRGKGRGRGHHFRGGPRDGCLMECVFQEEDWLENGKVNIETIMKRIEDSKNSENSKWIQVAQDAVQVCAKTPAEEGKKCQSGAEEFFMCMGRNIFLTCPEFKDEIPECETLRNFYKECPAVHPVPLKCHQHGPSRGDGHEFDMKYRGGHGPQRYYNHHH